MTFSFNFQVEDSSQTNGDNKVNESETQTIVWKECKEHCIEEGHKDKIPASVERFKLDEDEFLEFINSDVVTIRLKSSSYSGDVTPALEDDSDLVTGKYEGGMKIWECCLDLVQYLHEEKFNFSGKRVLELGCGAGLPGLYAAKFGAEVWFNDYNEDVLNEITIPNLLLNTPETTDQNRHRFFSGDWRSFETNILKKELNSEEMKFDTILTSETIYNQDNQEKLVSIFKNYLKKDGEVLVSGKTFYFGVGGGMRQFEGVVRDAKLDCKQVKTFNSGVTREILKVKLKSD